MNSTQLYVLTETSKLMMSGDQKIIKGIYHFQAGQDKIKMLESLNLGKNYKLEGPFTINLNNNSALYPEPDLLPKPNHPDIFPPKPPDFNDFFNKDGFL